MPMRHGMNQDAFREHSEQTWDLLEVIQGKSREHSGKIQGTFRENSEHFLATFREHFGNISTNFREHFGDIGSIFWQNSGNVAHDRSVICVIKALFTNMNGIYSSAALQSYSVNNSTKYPVRSPVAFSMACSLSYVPSVVRAARWFVSPPQRTAHYRTR
jgi:hypothetical protein